MKRCSVIIQGEGKGHFSQAMALSGILISHGHEISRMYLGRSLFRGSPGYFRTVPDVRVVRFLSPNFIHTPDRKGIRILLSVFVNLLLGPVYLFEAVRIGIRMRQDKSSHVINFYDPVGSLAARWFRKRAVRIVISHHFYLSHPDFIHPHGMESSYFWLQFMNRIMMQSANRVLALSFRKGKKEGKTEVVPPMIDERIRRGTYTPGDRDLCYFLNPGFVEEIIGYYRNHPELKADIFTDGEVFGEIPENVKIHEPSRENFIACMYHCKRIITTGGFDTVAEGFYLGIPLFLIPSENHYEQYCNVLDAAKTGMAFHMDELGDLEDVEFTPRDNGKFREWVEGNEEQTLL
ncbi:MAG: glycosyltransferase family protein [Bacteroidales bacterium]